MKRHTSTILAIFALLLSAVVAFADSPAPGDKGDNGKIDKSGLQGLERVENVVYGYPQDGGLLNRLSAIEKTLFGMELPGSLTEREAALERFVERGNETQPSLLFKMGLAEWLVLRAVYPAKPLVSRVPDLEKALENETREGALSARLERVISKILPGGVTSVGVSFPAGTVMKSRFTKTLTVRNVKKNDVVDLELMEDCVLGGALVAPRGSRVLAEVTKVKMPRSFGRPSEIGVEFKSIETLDGQMIPIFLGPKAKKAMELDTGTAGAAGASLLGAALIGPVGLAGGFLVRGNDKQIKEGTIAYVETSEPKNVKGFRIPGPMEELVGPDASAPQGSTPMGTQNPNP